MPAIPEITSETPNVILEPLPGNTLPRESRDRRQLRINSTSSLSFEGMDAASKGMDAREARPFEKKCASLSKPLAVRSANLVHPAERTVPDKAKTIAGQSRLLHRSLAGDDPFTDLDSSLMTGYPLIPARRWPSLPCVRRSNGWFEHPRVAGRRVAGATPEFSAQGFAELWFVLRNSQEISSPMKSSLQSFAAEAKWHKRALQKVPFCAKSATIRDTLFRLDRDLAGGCTLTVGAITGKLPIVNLADRPVRRSMSDSVCFMDLSCLRDDAGKTRKHLSLGKEKKLRKFVASGVPLSLRGTRRALK